VGSRAPATRNHFSDVCYFPALASVLAQPHCTAAAIDHVDPSAAGLGVQYIEVESFVEEEKVANSSVICRLLLQQ